MPFLFDFHVHFQFKNPQERGLHAQLEICELDEVSYACHTIIRELTTRFMCLIYGLNHTSREATAMCNYPPPYLCRELPRSLPP